MFHGAMSDGGAGVRTLGHPPIPLQLCIWVASLGMRADVSCT
jgi:hypothetical protein